MHHLNHFLWILIKVTVIEMIFLEKVSIKVIIIGVVQRGVYMAGLRKLPSIIADAKIICLNFYVDIN
ncbi:hypothetical protein A7985_13310 [Pseudoalteromonas luteoviolacea]|uniref:Uncharacterized protein n=1 Tax=Pseudoalteromonas luteoviolacea TaxID=43657 RepID=A0A1C0TPB5_9GAMM|nr:hypothetical protein A7985_13310 [Pseudoalteromonas luteoviolacea]